VPRVKRPEVVLAERRVALEKLAADFLARWPVGSRPPFHEVVALAEAARDAGHPAHVAFPPLAMLTAHGRLIRHHVLGSGVPSRLPTEYRATWAAEYRATFAIEVRSLVERGFKAEAAVFSREAIGWHKAGDEADLELIDRVLSRPGLWKDVADDDLLDTVLRDALRIHGSKKKLAPLETRGVT